MYDLILWDLHSKIHKRKSTKFNFTFIKLCHDWKYYRDLSNKIHQMKMMCLL